MLHPNPLNHHHHVKGFTSIICSDFKIQFKIRPYVFNVPTLLSPWTNHKSLRRNIFFFHECYEQLLQDLAIFLGGGGALILEPLKLDGLLSGD
jgi:hypothetical protein